MLLARHAAPRPPVQELPKRRGEIKSCSLLCFLHTWEGKHSLIFIPLKKAARAGLHAASQVGWAGTDIFLPIAHSHLSTNILKTTWIRAEPVPRNRQRQRVENSSKYMNVHVAALPSAPAPAAHSTTCAPTCETAELLYSLKHQLGLGRKR